MQLDGTKEKGLSLADDQSEGLRSGTKGDGYSIYTLEGAVRRRNGSRKVVITTRAKLLVTVYLGT